MTHFCDMAMFVAGALAFLIAGDLEGVLDNGVAFPKNARLEVGSGVGHPLDRQGLHQPPRDRRK